MIGLEVSKKQMATEALQKQQPPDEQIATYKRLYLAAWEQAFNEFMYLMAEQYSLELMIEAGEKQVPSPMVQFWRENLQDLSPLEMREGLKGYMASERRSFRPAPQDIRDNCRHVEAIDKPRKVFNPKCSDCSGTGFRTVLVDSKIHTGRKARKVTDCYCVSIEYGGKAYTLEQKQLPAAPEIEPKELLERIANKTGVHLAAKGFPERREQSEGDYNHRQRVLEEQRKKLGVKQ